MPKKEGRQLQDAAQARLDEGLSRGAALEETRKRRRDVALTNETARLFTLSRGSEVGRPAGEQQRRPHSGDGRRGSSASDCTGHLTEALHLNPTAAGGRGTVINSE